jgi:hypothetical protein
MWERGHERAHRLDEAVGIGEGGFGRFEVGRKRVLVHGDFADLAADAGV